MPHYISPLDSYCDVSLLCFSLGFPSTLDHGFEVKDTYTYLSTRGAWYRSHTQQMLVE